MTPPPDAPADVTLKRRAAVELAGALLLLAGTVLTVTATAAYDLRAAGILIGLALIGGGYALTTERS